MYCYLLVYRELSPLEDSHTTTIPLPLSQRQDNEERKNSVIYRIVKSLTSIGICLETSTCALPLTHCHASWVFTIFRYLGFPKINYECYRTYIVHIYRLATKHPVNFVFVCLFVCFSFFFFGIWCCLLLLLFGRVVF